MEIKEEARRLMKSNEKLLNDTVNQRLEAEGLLDSGIRNQQVRNTLYLSLSLSLKLIFSIFEA